MEGGGEGAGRGRGKAAGEGARFTCGGGLRMEWNGAAGARAVLEGCGRAFTRRYLVVIM